MKSIDRLLSYMNDKNIDAFFIAKKPNVRYISEYTGDDSFLLITKNELCFLTDPRYTEQASNECSDYNIVLWKEKPSLAACLEGIVQRLNIKTLAFESDNLSSENYIEFKDNIKVDLVPASGVIEKLRIIKSKEEISYLKYACDITCRAFERIIKDIKVGVTEKELAAKLSLYMVMEGSDTNPYGNILISGARTSLLHGIPSDKSIQYGDFVLMDFGCQYNGYLCDMTRTVIVGKPTEMQKEVYELEKQMIELSLLKMIPQTPLKDVYEESIKPILNTEYLQYHYQGIGHGIGLVVHEPPFMGPKSTDVLEVNSVRTIEPGIYIPNWGGVRIEDQILITETGYENLISTTHELIEL